MAGEINFVLSGDAQRLIKAYDDLIKRQEREAERRKESVARNKELRAELDRQKTVSDRLARVERERNKLMGEGAKLTQAMLSPQEQFNKSVKEAIDLKNKGAISSETLQRRFKQLKEELREATGENAKYREAEAAKQSLEKRGAQITSSLATATEIYRQKLRELESLHHKGAISAETLRRGRERLRAELSTKLNNDQLQQSNTILKGMTSQVGAYATGLLGVQQGVRLIADGWRQVQEEQRKGLSIVESTADANRRLLQISPDAKTFKRLQSVADQAATTAGIDRAEARNLLFDATSAGMSPQEFLRVMQSNEVIDPRAAVTAVGKVRQLFPGEKLTGPGVLAALLNSSQTSLADFETILGALSGPAAATTQLTGGKGFDEVAAATAVLTNQLKSSEQAGERIAAFAQRAAIDDRFKGKGLLETVTAVGALEDGKRKKFLGESQELNQAFALLSRSFDEITKLANANRNQRLEAQQGGGLVADRMAIAEGDTTVQALRSRRIAEQGRLAAEADRFGVEGARAEAAVDRLGTRLTEENFRTRFWERQLGVGEETSRIASSFGLPEERASELGQRVSRAVSSPFGIFGLGSFALSRVPFRNRVFGPTEDAAQVTSPQIEQAGASMMEAANQMKAAANEMTEAASRPVVPGQAARANAAQAE